MLQKSPFRGQVVIVTGASSGIGRELGPDALDAFTETKNVFFDTTS